MHLSAFIQISVSLYSLRFSTAPSNQIAQLVLLPTAHLSAMAEELITRRKATNMSFSPVTEVDAALLSFLGCVFHHRQIKKNYTGQRMSKMINALPWSMITPIFQESRLAQGFSCSAGSALPFEEPIRSLARGSLCPDPSHHCMCHMLSAHTQPSCWSQKARKQEKSLEHFLTKEKIRENILLKNTRSNGEGSPFIFHALGWFYYTAKPFYWISIVIMAG